MSQRKTVTTTEAARMVGVARKTFVRLADSHNILPATKTETKRDYFLTDVNKLINALSKERARS